jgi:predicted O-methyltransferase YrrM
MRFLVFNGVFAENDDGTFALNRAAEYLQTAHPRSLRPSAIRAGEGMWEVSSRLLSAVQTGRTPHDDVHGTTFFERIGESGRDNVFASRMSSSTAGLGDALAQLDCLKRARTIVDVGGGHGAVLVELLRAHPHLRGVLFDRPATLDGARALIESAGVSDRCELVAGDFFQGVPRGGDVYLLSWILHDWDDANAARILRACRDAGPEDAALLVVEVLLPPKAMASEGNEDGTLADPYTLDLQMLLLTGGRERTLAEYQELLRAAGYTLNATTSLTSARGASVIEAYVERR